MNILAVSDTQVKSLENMVVSSRSGLKNLDIIFSCGDLDKDYIEFLVDGINRELFFVSGNHLGYVGKHDACDEDFYEDLWEKEKLFKDKKAIRIAGKKDLHCRVVAYKGYYIAGFGGSKWYGGKSNEYTEKQMASVARKVVRKIKLLKLKDKLLKLPPKDVIILSHAPIFGIHDMPDKCHSGFECFRNVVKAVSPVLWLHGHVHLNEHHGGQATMLGRTTVINVFGYKFINLSASSITISNKLSLIMPSKS